MARLSEGHFTAEKIKQKQNSFKIANFTERKTMKSFHFINEYNEENLDTDRVVQFIIQNSKSLDEIWYVKTKLEEHLDDLSDKNKNLKDRMWLHEFRKKMRLK